MRVCVTTPRRSHTLLQHCRVTTRYVVRVPAALYAAALVVVLRRRCCDARPVNSATLTARVHSLLPTYTLAATYAFERERACSPRPVFFAPGAHHLLLHGYAYHPHTRTHTHTHAHTHYTPAAHRTPRMPTHWFTHCLHTGCTHSLHTHTHTHLGHGAVLNARIVLLLGEDNQEVIIVPSVVIDNLFACHCSDCDSNDPPHCSYAPHLPITTLTPTTPSS